MAEQVRQAAGYREPETESLAFPFRVPYLHEFPEDILELVRLDADPRVRDGNCKLGLRGCARQPDTASLV
jgi:hypothetical protein